MKERLTLETLITFGKYRDHNLTVHQMVKKDPYYTKWLIKLWNGNVDPKVYAMSRAYSKQDKAEFFSYSR